ncbi:hypothetical protein HCA50_14290 [Listeria innocua]|uniref:hypothetical protein n=1 Tax=Listeria innocua TaxID=1642 RepID=UPI001625F247|nr:hypothetical protein [Listeria innocua]MBC1904683.1 hypothetical protein [Listeria innocua]
MTGLLSVQFLIAISVQAEELKHEMPDSAPHISLAPKIKRTDDKLKFSQERDGETYEYSSYVHFGFRNMSAPPS